MNKKVDMGSILNAEKPLSCANINFGVLKPSDVITKHQKKIFLAVTSSETQDKATGFQRNLVVVWNTENESKKKHSQTSFVRQAMA